MRSLIPLLGLFGLLGCEGAQTPDPATVPATVATMDEGASPTGALFGPAPAPTLAGTADVTSAPAESKTLVDVQHEGQVLRGVFNLEAFRAFQAERSRTWGGAR